MAYGDFKDLNRRTVSDKLLLDKAFNIAENTKYDGHQHRPASIVYKFFDKKYLVVALKMRIFQTKNKLKNQTNQLLENFKNEKYTHLSQAIFDKGIRFLLCVIDIFSKYTQVIPLKDKKKITITNALQKVLNKYNRKPNKMWVDKGNEFYNTLIKSWVEEIAIETYSSPNKEKCFIDEGFIRTLKNKIYNYMT